jgi:pyruvate dehydrogenase E1 component alpha subunit
MAKGTTAEPSAAVKEADLSTNGAKKTTQKAATFDVDKYLKFYEKMVHIREFEELTAKAWHNKEHGMGGYLHLYSGEEAIAVGIIGAMDIAGGDCFIGHYRDHGYALAAGSDPGQVMAEICGKYTGCSKGKGGSMHICDAKLGFYGGYGIVGGNVPIALGLGWSIKYRGGNQVAVCFFGDGSINQGAFHETLNMAQLYRVPVLFVLENNGYAMGTSIERSHANTELYTRVDSYAMKRDRIDGQNIVTVHERASEIIAEMRENPAPFFLECQTYRYHGHGAADTTVTQSTYRTRDEVEEWKAQRDPLMIAEKILKEHKAISDAEIERIRTEALDAAHAALKFSDDSPYPPAEELLKDVYA